MSKFQVLSQRDPCWKKDLLGFDKESTIEGYGCLSTSMAMVANVYDIYEIPVTLNKKLKNAGGIQGA